MARRLRRLIRRQQRAEATVEFILLAPILLLLLFGIFELGRVVDAWVVVHNAAREGARAGAVQAPASATQSAADFDAQTRAAAAAAAAAYLQGAVASRSDLGPTRTATADLANGDVSVSVGVEVQLYTPLLRTVVAATNGAGRIPVRAAATMRRQ